MARPQLGSNALTGTIPAAWGAANVTWSNTGAFAASVGFDSLTLLDLSGNSLSGPIPASLSQLRATTSLNVYRHVPPSPAPRPSRPLSKRYSAHVRVICGLRLGGEQQVASARACPIRVAPL